MLKINKIVVGLLFLNISFLILTVALSTRIFTNNLEIAKINKSIKIYSDQNKEQRVKLAQIDSLDYITKKTKELGFKNNSRILYLMVKELAQK